MGQWHESGEGGDALIEGLVDGLGESLVEEGLTAEEQEKGALAVEVGDGEQAQIFERVVGQLMGLVDDEQMVSGVFEQLVREAGGGLAA